MTQNNCFLVVFIITAIVFVSLQCEYEKCPDEKNSGQYIDHTMCQYSPTPAERCNEVVQKYLDKSEETVVLSFHNKLRQRVANGAETRGSNGYQPAGNIPELQWDKKLAAIAQRWANQCRFDHDDCRNFDDVHIGQSVGFTSSSNRRSNFSKIIRYWYDEVDEFDNNLISNYQQSKRSMTVHYTQMIWANTSHVGCGGVHFLNTIGFYTSLLVCNYRRGGNIIGEAIYKVHGELQL